MSPNQNEGQSSPAPEPKKELSLEDKLKLKAHEYTEYFQNISCLVGVYFAKDPYVEKSFVQLRDAPDEVKTILNTIAGTGWDSALYIRDREDAERTFSKYKMPFLQLLNDAVHNYEIRKAERRYFSYDGTKFEVPDSLLESMVEIQKEGLQNRFLKAKSTLTKLVEDFKGFSKEAEPLSSELFVKISDMFGELYSLAKEVKGNQESVLDALEEVNPFKRKSESNISDEKSNDANKELVDSLRGRMTETLRGARTELLDLDSFATTGESLMLGYLDNVLARGIAAIQSHGPFRVRGPEKLSREKIRSWLLVQYSEARDEYESQPSEGEGPAIPKEAPNQMELSFDESRQERLDLVFEKIVDSLYALSQFNEYDNLKRHLPRKLRAWATEPYSAQHVRFLFYKAFENPEFFEKYPNVMGSHLVAMHKGKLIDKEDFPPKWIEPIGTRCGTMEPEFSPREFGFGWAMSTHFEPIMD